MVSFVASELHNLFSATSIPPLIINTLHFSNTVMYLFHHLSLRQLNYLSLRKLKPCWPSGVCTLLILCMYHDLMRVFLFHFKFTLEYTFVTLIIQ